jgi:hypothetical protein
MPAPSVEEIELNDELKRLKVTRFWKKGSVLQIMIGEQTLLQFDIDKTSVQKTKENLKDAAEDIDLDMKVLAELKFILAKDYVDYLRLEIEGKTDNNNKTASSSKTSDSATKGSDKEDKSSSAVIAINLAKA